MVQATAWEWTAQRLTRQSARISHAEPRRPIFLREVAEWDLRWQRMLFQILIPVALLVELSH